MVFSKRNAGNASALHPADTQIAAITDVGETDIDASAIADYFAPLDKWLDEQNEGQAGRW